MEETEQTVTVEADAQLAAARLIFEEAAFVSDIGMRLVGLGPGWCESELVVLPRHYTYEGFVHAGVQATMADHTAGTAATTLVGEGQYILSVEFKINMLRPAQGERLRCRAQVLKPGRTLIVTEAEVFAVKGGTETMVSKATVTLIALDKPGE